MSGTVLIVEDDTRIANWVKVYFERAGFSAEVAHDGISGLALARDMTPDLVILDLMLPRLDGVELCRILRRESDVPIIMLTAREAHAERIIGLDSGADDYIVKPFDPEEVIARAEAVLRRVKGRVQQVLTRGNITLNETARSVTVNEEPVILSQAQIALLSTNTTTLPIPLSWRPSRIWGNSSMWAPDRMLSPTTSTSSRSAASRTIWGVCRMPV